MSWAVVRNGKSGSAPDEAELKEALAGAGIQAEVLDAARVLPTLDRSLEPFEVLVAVGGDGTVSSVAASAVRLGKTFGVIPGGTLNHFARDIRVPHDLEQAIGILAAGHTRMLDVGVLNDRIFINNASIGAYPRMVWERNRARERGLPRPIALGLAVIHTWIDLRSTTVRMTIDGREVVRRSPFIFIGNSEYEFEGVEIGRRPTMTNGRLSMYVAPYCGRVDALLLPARALIGALENHDKFETFEASEITIETPRRSVGVGLDGEIWKTTVPLRVSVRRGVLRTLLPSEQNAGDE